MLTGFRYHKPEKGQFDYEKLTRDKMWGALRWQGQEYPDQVQGNLKETKWVWGFVDEKLGVNLKNEKGREIKTNFEPENEKLRWFTEKRDKYRAFNVPDEEKETEKDEVELNIEEPV